MKKPKVSIIIPNYNHKIFLEERLHSIFNQTFQDFEVIILDDASDDGSAKILEKFSNHLKVTHFLFNEKNTGSPFKQWKKGLELSQGEYVWIAESDDCCEINFLETTLKIFDENLDASIVVAKTLKYNQGKTQGEIQHHIFKNDEQEEINQNNINFCPILNVSSCVFKNPQLGSFGNEFSNYKLIGDRVFYHEFFYNQKVLKNNNTLSYFRKENDSVSTLKTKGLGYLNTYFIEHLKFIDYVNSKQKLPKKVYNHYLSKFFKRVRDRMNKKDKLNLTYLLLVIKYKSKLK